MLHEDPTMSPGAGPAARSPGPDAGSLVGRTLGAYHVLSLLGEGGFGAVYLAEQEAPVRRRVALKVIRPGMDSRAVVARFEAERQALALMDHPGVAKVYDAGVSELGRPYFAMELVRGVPINAFCEQERLGIDDRVRLMIQVCGAVQHAHMKGLIHRDLKPGNILVELVDGKPTAKIIDFGVAKAISQRLTDSTLLTEQGQMIGTPEYMSPEQARGSAVDVDTRADVYSLGAILYELLTGSTPFDSRELRAGGHAGAQRMIEERLPARPSDRVTRQLPAAPRSGTHGAHSGTLSRRLRGDLDWIAMRCLEKERARRYDSAGALAEDLERYLKDEPVTAGPPSAGYRAMKFVRRHRGGVIAAGVTGAALVGAVIATGWGLSQAVRERQLAMTHASLADTARAEAEAVVTFLSDMLGSVDPGESGRDVRVREVLDRAARSIGGELKDRPLVEARLRQTIGNAYRGLGLYEDADRHLSAATAIRTRELGEAHPDTLRVQGNIAGLRHQQGRYEESVALTERVLGTWTGSGGADDAAVLGLKNNLAQTYSRQGLKEKAAALQTEVVEGQRRVQGPDHPHTLGAMVNLSALQEDLGLITESETLLNEAIEGWRRAHGPDHPGTLLAMSNLAGLYMRQRRLPEAESLYRRVLEARTRVLGEVHPDTLGTMTNLGLTLSRMGRPEDAEPLYVKAWGKYREVLGEDHPDTLTTAMNLTTVYESMGWPDANREHVAGLLTMVRAVAARPGTTPRTLNECAWLLLTVQPDSLRDGPAALRAATRACDQERAAGGVELWQYLDTLALAQFRTGSPATAAQTQREAVGLLRPENERFRAEMEQRLHEFEAAAGGGG